MITLGEICIIARLSLHRRTELNLELEFINQLSEEGSSQTVSAEGLGMEPRLAKSASKSGAEFVVWPIRDGTRLIV